MTAQAGSVDRILGEWKVKFQTWNESRGIVD